MFTFAQSSTGGEMQVRKMDPAAQNEDEKDTHLQLPGPILTFDDVRYVVNVATTSYLRRKKKEILHGVSGIIKPGLNAILGPTGSGKTSLLDVLASRKDPKGFRSGKVLLNGQLLAANFNLQSAYVVQDDILRGTLTVRENLEFSANLRLSRKDHTAEQKKQKVDEIIEELGLQDCIDIKIGTDLMRGISGGERKRCSIGMELITSPSLIFLDEPTTGLDTHMATSVIRTLHKLSRNGRSIVFSIHQPCYSICKMFDYITLMSKGEIVYQGPGGEITNYFKDLGYECDPYNDHAQFFLDVINGAVLSSHGNSSPEAITSHVILDPNENKNLLAHQFRQSALYQQINKEVKNLSVPDNSRDSVSIKYSYPTPFWYQLYILSGCTLKNLWRNPQVSLVQVSIMLFFGILNGLIYYNIPNTMPEALQNRIGAFFFIIINQMFGNLSAVEIFIQEKVLFIHENASGYYRTSAYFLSKVLVDLIPNRIIPILIFSSITYFLMGLKLDIGSFFLFYMTLSLTSLSAVSMAFLVSASVSTFATANALIALPYVVMMVFGGFLVNLNKMLHWLSWLKWMSIVAYGLKALIINELKGQIFYTNSTIIPGEVYMIEQGIDYSVWGFWQNQLALFCLMIIFLLLSFIQLLRIDKWK
ncbi:broad substrate specificity ATP-binding cassette transporter ABCG2-like isoform X2 [Amblyraja radiata]|uniref:broad substrate specificity ATP-binding cassette transporter ABCG2-like isoform X2 n=1 Tax=Amblyraja radiata TaxID=386614 RepID=UPI001402CA85|nr:broad substrate specificity ATP-binding cassette transporter ABCG2-like isoform X2 [Amblyraja radiata]